MVDLEASLTSRSVEATARRHAGHPLATESSCSGKVSEWL